MNILISLIFLSPQIDGIITSGEGWNILGWSYNSTGIDGANLDTLYGAISGDTLFLAIKTANTQSWNVAYGFAIDLDHLPDSGYDYLKGNSDAWGRLITFSGTKGYNYSVEYEVYFWWDGAGGSITGSNLIEYTSGGWNYLGVDSFAFSGDNTTGLSMLEFYVILPSFKAAHVSAWVAGDGGSSAVDVIPKDSQVSDGGGAEWTDSDTLYTFARISKYRRSGNIYINEVLADPPYTEPEAEWVELFNADTDTIDASFWFFTDFPDPYSTSEGRIRLPVDLFVPPSSFVILANDIDTFNKYYSADVPSISDVYYVPLTGSNIWLANAGDDIHLFGGNLNPFQDTTEFEFFKSYIDSVWYGNGDDMGGANAAPAPAARSIERIPPALNTGIPANDFFIQQSPNPWSPGDIPPVFIPVSINPPSIEETTTVTFKAVVFDRIPAGDSVAGDTFFINTGTITGYEGTKVNGDTYQIVIPAPPDTGNQNFTFYIHLWDTFQKMFYTAEETLFVSNVPPVYDTIYSIPDVPVDTNSKIMIISIRKEYFPSYDSMYYYINGTLAGSGIPDSSKGDTLYYTIPGPFNPNDTFYVKTLTVDASNDTGYKDLTFEIGTGVLERSGNNKVVTRVIPSIKGIKLILGQSSRVKVAFYDIQGRKIYEIKKGLKKGNYIFAPELRKSVYFYIIETGGRKFKGKWIKVKD